MTHRPRLATVSSFADLEDLASEVERDDAPDPRWDTAIPIPKRGHDRIPWFADIVAMPYGASKFVTDAKPEDLRSIRNVVRPDRIAQQKRTEDGVKGHRLWKLRPLSRAL